MILITIILYELFMVDFVIIDSSYYNFYRFTATVSWYNRSEERRESAINTAWLDNPIFMATYKKMWLETIKKICKKFNVKQSQLIFARDGSKVWRYDIYPQYKATRKQNDDIHAPGPVFKYTNSELLTQLYSHVIKVDSAEGDDIIAVTVNYLGENIKIAIITGDHDLLQLSKPGIVDLYTLNGFKNITVDNPNEIMMYKILAGDPSDNIPPIFKGCGKVTAKKLARDPNLLAEALKTYGYDQFNLNVRLIDFGYIPDNVVTEIEEQLNNCDF